jgi:hypothetical protein
MALNSSTLGQGMDSNFSGKPSDSITGGGEATQVGNDSIAGGRGGTNLPGVSITGGRTSQEKTDVITGGGTNAMPSRIGAQIMGGGA